MERWCDVVEMSESSEGRLPGSSVLHQPVLVSDVVALLAPRPNTVVVDCTVGGGGHSLAVLPHLMPGGRLLAVDRDAQALSLAASRLTEFTPTTQFIHDDFRRLGSVLARLGVPRVDGLVADLGISSFHVDQPERGFSFSTDGPLDMRMDRDQTTTAAELLRRLSEQELAHLFQTYGEERYARRIARRIVERRDTQAIVTTAALAQLVRQAVPPAARTQRIHPATRTFLALRIVVNDELSSLQALLHALPDLLAPGGRAVVISFHSLEDRMVKHAFREGAAAGVFRVLTKKPVRPSEEEVQRNPRSRSAKLRAVERVG